jgi:hypothetical protein
MRPGDNWERIVYYITKATGREPPGKRVNSEPTKWEVNSFYINSEKANKEKAIKRRGYQRIANKFIISPLLVVIVATVTMTSYRDVTVIYYLHDSQARDNVYRQQASDKLKATREYY